MKKLIIAILLLSPSLALGAEEGGYMLRANNDLGNLASLQRGAKYFMNYCSGCHSTKYVRYRRLEEDLHLTEDQLTSNLMFTADKPTQMVMTAMPADKAEQWFGRSPPDLSLTARSRGVDWIYTYLKSFYLDDSKATGVNNLVLPNAAMPHVLWELQGFQKAVFKDQKNADGNAEKVFDHFELVTPGRLTPEEYDGVVRDIVNYLDYVGEPAQMQRLGLGIDVLGFLLVFFLFAFFLKKEYWRDVH